MSNLATIVNNILADSGIDDINVVVTNGSYTNPAWIVSLPWTKITGTPTTLAGYGITDAYTQTQVNTLLSGYLPLGGGTLTGTLQVSPSSGVAWYYANRVNDTTEAGIQLRTNGTPEWYTGLRNVVGQSTQYHFYSYVTNTSVARITSAGQFIFAGQLGNGTHTYTLPNATGTLALTSDIPVVTGFVTLDTTQTITGQKTISRAAAIFSGTTQSFLIDGAAGQASITLNAASFNYAYQTFSQGGVAKFEMGIVGNGNNGSLYINSNVQTGETGASIYIKKSNGFVGINNTDPQFNLDVTGKGRFTASFGDNNPIIALTGTSTEGFQYLTTAYNASLESGKQVAHFLGRSSSLKNSGYLAYQWNAAGSDDNFISLGHYGNDHILRVYGDSGITTKGWLGVQIRPVYTFQVYNDADVWHSVIGGATGQLRIGGQTSDGAVIGAYTPGSTSRQLYLQRDGGNVIINGTSNPGDRLYVNGTGRFDSRLGIGASSGIYSLQLGTDGSLANSIRMGNYQVPKNTRQYIGYVRFDSGLFESSGNGDTPSTVLGGVAGIRIVNTEGILFSPAADNSVQLLTHIYNGGSRVALHANYDGFVGINGVTNPTYALDVNGTGRFSSDLTLSSTGNAFILLNNTTPSTGRQWRVSSGSNGTLFFTHVGVVDALQIAPSTGAATFSSSVTSTGLIVNGQEFYYAPADYSSGGFTRLLGRNSSTGRIEGMSAADIQAFIGLGSYVTLTTAQTITGQKTISREAVSYSGTTQSFLIDGAAGNGALTINSASAYAYQTFAQAGTGKFEMGIVGTLGAQYGSLYINRNIQSGETGASIYIKKADGFVGINNIDPQLNLDVTGAGRFTNRLGVGNNTAGFGDIVLISNSDVNVYPRVNRSSTSNEAGWKYSTGGTDSWYIGLRSADGVGSYHFYSYTTNSSVCSITNNGRLLVGKTSDNGNRFQVLGDSYFDGLIFSAFSNGLVRTSNADAAGMLHIRPNAGQNGYINFTENAVDDRWSIGITAGDGNFYFRRPYPTSPAVVSISTGGVIGANGATINGVVTINRNMTGLVLNRDAVTNYNGIYYSTAGSPRWFIGLRENLSSNNYICYSEQTAVDVMTLNLADNSARFAADLSNNGLFRTRGTSNDVFWAGASQSASFGAVLGEGNTGSRTAFFRSSSTTAGASVWWGLVDSSGRNIPCAAIDGISTGGLSFWHNSAGSGGGSWTNIFLYNLSGVQIYGTLSVSSSVTATSFFESSDSRIKTELDDVLDYAAIANVTAKYYEKNGKVEIGYFAQDFETLLPSAISKNEDGYLNLSYREVHTAKIAYLEKRITELEKQLKNK
jgi:hypothetical protein